MDPFTLMMIMTVFTSFTQVMGGVAAKREADYNAKVVAQQAQAAEQKAAFDLARERREQKKFRSRQTVSALASGLTIESFTDVFAESAKEMELDALAIQYGGAVTASQARSEAAGIRYAGKQKRTAAFLKAGGTLLSGASKASTMNTGSPDIWT